MARRTIFAAVLWAAVCCFAAPETYEAFHKHLCDPARAFYKAKAVELYAWGRRTLVPDGARVADGIHKGGPEFHDHLYNQATYSGAACLLHRLTGEARYLDDARKAADYVRDAMCRPQPGVPTSPSKATTPAPSPLSISSSASERAPPRPAQEDNCQTDLNSKV